MWLTQADTAPRPDLALRRTSIIGRVVGGDGHADAINVPLGHRLWAAWRFARFAWARVTSRTLRRGSHSVS